MESIEQIIQKSDSFIFWWIATLILLLPFTILLFRWHSAIQNIQIRGSAIAAVLRSKFLAIVFSFIAGLIVLFILFKVLNGAYLMFLLAVKGKAVYAAKIMDPRTFFFMWLVGSLIILELGIGGRRGMIFKSVFFGGAYNLIAILFAVGFILKEPLLKFEGNAYWISASITILLLRYNLWKKGV